MPRKIVNKDENISKHISFTPDFIGDRFDKVFVYNPNHELRIHNQHNFNKFLF